MRRLNSLCTLSMGLVVLKPRSLWIHPQGHLSAVGYRVVAEALIEALDGLR